ncbi:MAG: hypothetical protein KAI34_03450 [Candidatus Lokiarchaeota archaeon]|nr:hypothetical protein [Candidatus Lokiarchaeota archaeon]
MSLSREQILVIGGGEVGYTALKFCKKNNFSVIIIDSNPHCKVRSEVDLFERNHDFDKIKQIPAGKSILFAINESLNELPSILQRFEFEYIIPAIPIHAMAKLTYVYLNQKGIEVKPAPDLIQSIKRRIDPSVIHNYDEKEGIIVASYMPYGQECAPNCCEFMECPVAGIEKSKPLHEILKDASIGVPAKILVSKQITANLGGIPGKSVNELFSFIDLLNDQMIIGTACMCHGIINAIEFTKSKSSDF